MCMCSLTSEAEAKRPTGSLLQHHAPAQHWLASSHNNSDRSADQVDRMQILVPKKWRAAVQPNLCADGCPLHVRPHTLTSCQLLMCCINCWLQMIADTNRQYHSQPVGVFREQSCHSSGAKPTCYGPEPAPQAEAWQPEQARECPHQSSGCGSDGVAAALRRLRALLALK